MKPKSMPANLYLFCLSLGFLVLVGTCGSVGVLVRWQREGMSVSVAKYLFVHTFFWLASMAAVRAVVHKRSYAVYLGLAPLLVLFGFSCRFLGDLLVRPIFAQTLAESVYVRMATLGFVIALATFILKLGFSRTVAAYFTPSADS